MLCDHKTGVPFHMELYDSKADGGIPRMVATAVSQLEVKHHVIYCDKLFTSPRQFVDLLRLGHYATGTCVTNRTGVPSRVEGVPVPNSASRGEYACAQRGQLLFVSAKDTGVVNMLTTFRQADEGGRTTRWINHERKSVNTHKALEDYNRYMAAVDKFRSLLASYRMALTTRRWNLRVGFELWDTMIAVAYQFQKLGGGTYVPGRGFHVLSHLEFRAQLVTELLASANPKPADATRYLPGDHFPAREIRSMPSKKDPNVMIQRHKQYDCVWCRRAQKHIPGTAKHKWTTVCCEACKVGLCITPCFKAYHKYSTPYDEGAESSYSIANPGYKDTQLYQEFLEKRRRTHLDGEA